MYSNYCVKIFNFVLLYFFFLFEIEQDATKLQRLPYNPLYNPLNSAKRKVEHPRKFLRTQHPLSLSLPHPPLLSRSLSQLGIIQNGNALSFPRIIWAIVLNIKDKAAGLLHEASLLFRALTPLVAGRRRNATENILHFANASPTRHEEITPLSVKCSLIF